MPLSPSPSAGPSRKRPRSELSSEDRKEARAHRNRIAAQNSRDRRKAQFSYLERRVQELEEENRQLRAGMGLAAVATQSPVDEARDRENQELKDRIRTLEKGWDAVVKALAAQGLPTGLSSDNTSASSPSSSSTPAPPSSIPDSTPSAPVSAPSNQPPSQSASDFPISPAPSHSSLDLTTTFSSASPALSERSLSDQGEQDQSTRHLARVATIPGSPPRMSLQRSSSDFATPVDPVDDATMEALFSEILAPNVCPSRPSSPVLVSSTTQPTESLSALGLFQAPSAEEVTFTEMNTGGPALMAELSADGFDTIGASTGDLTGVDTNFIGELNLEDIINVQGLLDLLPMQQETITTSPTMWEAVLDVAFSPFILTIFLTATIPKSRDSLYSTQPNPVARHIHRPRRRSHPHPRLLLAAHH
ncbi:hypothetical protein D9758_006863 [Tetrapyrgos nigripes]|uniref:X-box-binding protein 1 n=1 Tax=Tetrapyrgos nigripes TaxID=182062 RepID=A0A8H5CVG0_9AGAR|nr:hypothetical protein D9758_006863 [Tetrapyrgos nigripes]